MIFLLLFLSCSRRQDSVQRSLPRPAVKEASKIAPQAENIAQEEDLPALPTLPPATQEHIMLPLARRERSLPEDFKIGRLQDQLAGYGDQAQLLATVRLFLSGLTAASVTAESLLPEAAPALDRYLKFYLERDIVPTDYRLGSLSYLPESSGEGGTPQQARLGIRLFNQDPAASTLAASEGALYLERRAEQWLIADLQIDFQTLADPYVRGKQKFIPSSYRWLAGGS